MKLHVVLKKHTAPAGSQYQIRDSRVFMYELINVYQNLFCTSVQQAINCIPYLFELTHRVRRPNFERVPHIKIKNTYIHFDVN